MRTKFIRSILAIAVLLGALQTTGYAQGHGASEIYVEPSGFSIGMTLGMSDLWGDVGTKSVLDHYNNSKYTGSLHGMGGLFGRYTIHPALGLRFSMDYGTLYATDAWNKNKAEKAKTQGDDAFQRYVRNQDIKDIVWEPSLMLEIVPFRLNPESAMAHRAGQPYLLAGISYFHFQPYSTHYPQDAGGRQEMIKIYDLHTEGQGFGPGYPPVYSLWQMAIPLGMGYRWDIGQHLNLGIEWLYRITFTDYLDGVSGNYVSQTAFEANLPPDKAALAYDMSDKTYVKMLSSYPNAAGSKRGNASNKDSYSTISVSFYYKVKSHAVQWWD